MIIGEVIPMKLMMVIVNEEYQRFVSELFQEKGYPATVVACTGDFLQYGDTIFILGVDEDQANIIIKLLSNELGDCKVLQNEGNNNDEAYGQLLRKANIFYMDVFQYAKINKQG